MIFLRLRIISLYAFENDYGCITVVVSLDVDLIIFQLLV